MASYAADLITRSTASLQHHLALLSPPNESNSPLNGRTTTDVAALGQAADEGKQQDERHEVVLATLYQLTSSSRRRITTISQLGQLLRTAFPPLVAVRQAAERTRETDLAELVLLAHVVIVAYGISIDLFVEEFDELQKEDEYWKSVQMSNWTVGEYLLQTTPLRIIDLTTMSIARLRESTTFSRSSIRELSLGSVQKAIPFSLLITSIFPHLASASSLLSTTSSLSPRATTNRLSQGTRRLLGLTMSPLTLTQQEIGIKRKAIRREQDSIAEMIGELTILSRKGDGLLQSMARGDGEGTSLENLQQQVGTTIVTLDNVFSGILTHSRLASLTIHDLARALSNLFTYSIPRHSSSTRNAISLVRQPSFVTRVWPYIVAVPLVSVFLGRRIYNARATLLSYARDGRQTMIDFVLDWVLAPLHKIVLTIRHSEGGTMKLMSGDSLKSDLASLQRMVIDFSRDEYGLSGEQVALLGEKVREGDLTTVLQAFEKDIRHPLRSAVAGSLIRTLLIQVQKMKVDVALAMDGIEKMLASQQLTFGFVGVAPSLIITVGFVRWLEGLVRKEGVGRQEMGRRMWTTLRHLDLILSPTGSSKTLLNTAAQTQGYLLLELSSLRAFARSPNFPSRDAQLREAFLQDVRALEDCGDDVHGGGGAGEDGERRVLLERLWRWRERLREEY